jgi:hypothetical protein
LCASSSGGEKLMKTKWMPLVIGSASGIALAATVVHSADRRPMVVQNITGNLHIVQTVPCDTLIVDTPVTQGQILITPAEGVDVAGGKSFVLIGFTISFAPFTMRASCRGFERSRTYNLLTVQLGKAVAFTASDRGGGEFDVRIPKGDFLIYESAVVDGHSLEKSYQHPSQDVTGIINLTRGTAAMHVVVARNIHFEEGCTTRPCTIDEEDPGTLTVNLAGTIAFPDSDGDGVADRDDNCRFVSNPDQSPVATPTIVAPPDLTLASCADHHIGLARATDVCNGGPVTITNDAPGTFPIGSTVVTWTARDAKLRAATDTQTVTIVDTTPPSVTCLADGPPGGTFQVSASDDCDVPTIRLGSFVLANGERIKIEETGQRGVMLLNDVGPDRIRHFRVGKGEAVIIATDAARNSASARCR